MISSYYVSLLLEFGQNPRLTALEMSNVYLKSHSVHAENKKIGVLILFHTCSGKRFSGEVQLSFSVH